MLKEEYLSYLSSIRRYSQRTCSIYGDILDEFYGWSGSGDDSNLLESLTPQMIRGYEVWLMDSRGLGPGTVHQHLSVLSGFCRHLIKRGKLKSNPARLVARPKTEKRLPAFYRKEAMADYFKSTQNYVDEGDLGMISRYEARLRRLIVSILYNAGIRRSELLGLRIADMDFGRRTLRIHGKGNKMREIPVIDELCEEISLYLQSVIEMVGCGRTAESPLLVTAKGGKLYPVYVDRAVKKELGTIGSITGRRSPHVLRHTLATELLNEGTDLESIKELLGHSSLAATQVYTHTSVERLKQVYNDAHPRAKSGGKKNGNQD